MIVQAAEVRTGGRFRGVLQMQMGRLANVMKVALMEKGNEANKNCQAELSTDSGSYTTAFGPNY